MTDDRSGQAPADARSAPAVARNREPIAEVLRNILPPQGQVLEIASGTGEHAVFFAKIFPDLQWQPSDGDLEALDSIAAWRRESGVPNVREPIHLDVSGKWPALSAEAILAINMVHISPWSATEGLLRGAAGILPAGGPLILYGPYRRAGVPTAPSNEDFDAWLKARNSLWGLRDVEAVDDAAKKYGLAFDRLFEMPANNVTLVFRRN